MHQNFRYIFIFSIFFGTTVQAHDFWLEANSFYTEPAKTVDLSIIIGEQFVGDTIPNIPNWQTDFSRFKNGQRIAIDGELGDDPAGHFTPENSGTYIIGYQSDFTNTEFEPDRFLKYLKMEGLDNAIQYRIDHNQTDIPGTEDYIRHAKTLIQSGSQFAVEDHARSFGYELEIYPLSNPYRLTVDDTLDFQVLYQGRPEHEILLIAFSKNNPEELQQIRTDQHGKARIKLNQSGPWLIKAVKIIRIQKQDADWQSHWASLTFEIKSP